jgi:site-specific DNA recombinase
MDQPIYVIGYARVSTNKQAQTGESLEDQERAIKRHCDKMGWTLFPANKVYKEPSTGTKLDRPVYNEILEMLKANKKAINIKFFVFWDFDRLTRAGTIDYDKIWSDVKSYGVELRDTTGVIQSARNAFEEFGFDFEYSWAIARPSEDTERQKVEEAKRERMKILQRLIKPGIQRTQEGYQIGVSDYGFENKKVLVQNKKKCIQVRYEPEAKFVERIYKLRAEGILSDQEICDDVNALGYKSRIKNK